MTTISEQQHIVRSTCKKFNSIPWVPITKQQYQTSRDRPAKGPVWISRITIPQPPETALRDALLTICGRLKAPHQSIAPARDVPLLDVAMEFVGYRHGVAADAVEPAIAETAKLRALESECENDMTILYLHGGGLYFSSPTDYRSVTTRLARLTKARVVAPRYRLTPQNPFPGQILDALITYASLLHPPPGSSHSAVPANRIILAGNSSGGNLCLALTKLLLELQKSPTQLYPFHGNPVPLPLPAGLTTCSGWADCCDIMPSWLDPGAVDILGVLQPALQAGFPTDSVWPSTPPREHLYCVAAMLDHELVSPAAVRDWSGAPPMWFACGSLERGVDGNKVVASQAARSGVKVQWVEYEGMLHEFMIILGQFPQSKHCFESWAEACKAFVGGRSEKEGAVSYKMPACAEAVYLGDVKNISPLPFEEVKKRMRQKNSERPVWTGEKPAVPKI